MKPVRIHLPKFLDDDLSRKFSETLSSAISESAVTLDFSATEFAYPLGTLIAGREIRYFIQFRKQQKLLTMVAGIDPTKSVHSFLGFIGFFDFVGVPNNTRMGLAKGSTSYVPIRRYTRDDVMGSGRASAKSIHDTILKCARELADVLVVDSPNTSSYKSILYSLKEVIRNVFEHSGADECFVTAQRWATGEVEVAVIDEGVGIRASLDQAVSSQNDLDAIRSAIQPGVSRAMNLNDAANKHGNSGFGLYVLSELGRCFGRFIVGSGSSAIQIELDKITPIEVNFHGTFVGLNLNKPIYDFESVLNDIVSAGESDAALAGITANASQSSRSSSLE